MQKSKVIELEKELWRCRKVIGIFEEFLDSLGHTCVVESDKFGIIVLQYEVRGRFECNEIFRGAEHLFHALFAIWEFEWLYRQYKKGDYDEFDVKGDFLPEEQKKEMKEEIAFFEGELNRIMAEEIQEI